MSEIASSPVVFEGILREARRWSARAGIPIVEATLSTESTLLHVHWSEPETRVSEFLGLAEKLGASYVIVELDRLFEEDVEESLAVAVGMNATPTLFAELWNCRERLGQVCFLRLTFVDPKSHALFHLELQSSWYNLIFNTRETLDKKASADEIEGDKSKADPWGEA